MNTFDKYGLYIHSDDDFEFLLSTKVEKNIFLSAMLDFWNDPEEIKEIVLPDIERVLNRCEGEASDPEKDTVESDVIGLADLTKETTFLGNSDVGYKDMTLSTKDFKQLWLEWVDALEKHEKTKKPWGYVPTSWDTSRVADEIHYAMSNMIHLFGNTYEGKTTDEKRIKLIILDGVLKRISARSVLPDDYSKKIDLPSIEYNP